MARTEQEMADLEEKIVAQCELRKTQGWRIMWSQGDVRRSPWGGCVACALGSFANEDEIDLVCYSDIAARALGLTLSEARSFAQGFDGYRCDPVYDDPTFFALGQRVAARVLG